MTAFAPTSVILYVTDVEASTIFYRQALNKEPIETFKDFAVFALTDNVIIGLQTRDQIDPAATGTPGSVELSMSYATHDDVDQLYHDWTTLGFPIALEPTTLEFGYTFVATDPDGHRLRVCATDPTNL
ncbi:phenazine biosynthesis protein [Arthrobacter sp. HMSC06H05]|uniref:Phenazine biosynthesis protein n=2 Tax=Pseudoglutamicibacter albus TaxID=98671 RepID=A0A095ZNR0_9MICC|nr:MULTISPECIES: VOC family protein [Micrococcaceae]KGF20222.1 phenazine biosynthesis protein [Pseudoglutamicibacter albus DNF00011]MCG7303941.1 VOC family protein [Pseudoglutamicibacter albus]MDR7294336.1 putative lactoylglutathione lyase [Pseudoglutamicibacter albus]OFT42647.1 phenazine biosynthesis protein [Arthrobacter sp. HMSC06H05]